MKQWQIICSRAKVCLLHLCRSCLVGHERMKGGRSSHEPRGNTPEPHRDGDKDYRGGSNRNPGPEKRILPGLKGKAPSHSSRGYPPRRRPGATVGLMLLLGLVLLLVLCPIACIFDSHDVCVVGWLRDLTWEGVPKDSALGSASKQASKQASRVERYVV